jgi:hypothetical protein
MAGKKIGELTPLGRNLIATDELELSLAGSAGSRKITGQEIIDSSSTAWGDITGTLSSQTDLWTALLTKQAVLISGTNIKTVKGQSLVGPGNVDITKATVGLSMVNNTSDVDKPISTATQTALNAKQATLVSGTNIKSINGSSVLGSGDLTISGGGGICSVIPLASGQYTYVQATAGPPSNSTAYSNAIYLQPYIPAQSYTCDFIILHVNTGQSGGLGKIGIYDHVNGLPENLIYESADIDCSTVGVKSIATSFDFVAGEMYWMASNFNVINISIKQLNTYARIPINTLGYTASPSYSFRKLQNFGSFPNPIGGDVFPFPFETLPYLAFRKL